MPLEKSSSEEAKNKNLHELLYSGYPVKQAVAIALHNQDESRKKEDAKGSDK